MRSVGGLGMSVGTSLAFEGPGASSVRSSDTVLFNLRTLIRNAQESYEKDDPEYKDVDQIVKDVESDIVILSKWLEQARAGKVIKMVIYYPTYALIKLKYKHATLWEPTTELQKAKAALSAAVAKKLMSKYEKLITQTIMGMPEFKGMGIVMTHHAVDLAEERGYSRLHLLESHTGLLKPFTQWYTKLTGGKELHNMPFNRLSIQIFGDNSTNFRSSSIGIKNLLKKLAEEHNWTTATSLSRVRSTISNLPQGVDRAGLMMML